ncbi:hypothetical protein [Fluviicola sp.]|uniref:hypothetical protein n=1 Tax=Fluviicola sp. TaxID=1917219 RepID=UPI0031E485FD
MYIKDYPIVVFNNSIHDESFGLIKARSIFFSDDRKTFVENEIILSEEELLENSVVKILDIINEQNDSMIGMYEDDIIDSNEVKQNCLIEIEDFCRNHVCSVKVLQLIDLLKWAIDQDKNVYFLF